MLSTDAESESSLALDSRIEFDRVIATYRRSLIGDLQLTLSSSFGDDAVLFAGSQLAGQAPSTSLKIQENTLGYRMRIHGKLSERFRLDTGLDIASRVTTYELFLPLDDDFRGFEGADIPEELLRRTVDAFGIGWHGDIAWDVGAGVRLIPGLRLDGYLLGGEPRWSIDPRLVWKRKKSYHQ